MSQTWDKASVAISRMWDRRLMPIIDAQGIIACAGTGAPNQPVQRKLMPHSAIKLSVATISALLTLVTTFAQAQTEYPTRLIRLVVPVPPGPLLDAVPRIIADKLSDKVQIMMVPSDGKFFFANDVMHGAMPVTLPSVNAPDHQNQ